MHIRHKRDIKAHMHAYIHIHTYIHTYTYTYTYIHIHIHTHTYITYSGSREQRSCIFVTRGTLKGVRRSLSDRLLACVYFRNSRISAAFRALRYKGAVAFPAEVCECVFVCVCMYV